MRTKRLRAFVSVMFRIEENPLFVQFLPLMYDQIMICMQVHGDYLSSYKMQDLYGMHFRLCNSHIFQNFTNLEIVF